MQNITFFHGPKNDIFRMKNSEIFLICLVRDGSVNTHYKKISNIA